VAKATEEIDHGKVKSRQDQTGFQRRHWTLLHHYQNKRTMPEKLELKKFDPVVRQHVVYKEAKIK